MREIDKQTLTYRPQIDYDIVLSQSIRNKVYVNNYAASNYVEDENDNITTHKTDLLTEYEEYNPAIVIEKLIEAQDMRDRLKSELEAVNNLSKQSNKDFGGDEYSYSITDPVIHDTTIVMKHIVEEIDSITKLIQELFDLDDSDNGLVKRLEVEYEKINDAIAKEKAEISFYNKYQLSDIELAYVDELMKNSANNINSYDDYINKIIEEYRERGAKGVDYEDIRSATKKSYMAQHLLEETINIGEQAIQVHNYNMSDLFNNLVDDTLVYLVDHASRSDVKDMSELNYRKAIRDANVVHDNIARYNDIDFRNALNNHLMELENVRRRYAYTSEKEAMEELEPSMRIVALSNNTKSLVDSNWENILVDRIGATNALSHQMLLLLHGAMTQKEYSLMYRFADKIDREFDFEHKDKELAVFNSRNQIYSMR